MYNNFDCPPWASPKLLTPPKEQTQSCTMGTMASRSQAPEQLQKSQIQLSQVGSEPPSALLMPDDTSDESHSSDDNNVLNESGTLPDDTSDSSNSSGNNNVPPEPKIYYGQKRIYVYPKDHPYDEELPPHWGPKELAHWNAIKQEKIEQGEEEWARLIEHEKWDKKKKGVFVYWAWVPNGRHYSWVLCKDEPPKEKEGESF